jgi:hypothetical protein
MSMDASGVVLGPPLLTANPLVEGSSYWRSFINVLDWQVRFDPVLEYLELSESWYCDDKDPAHP